MPFSFLHSYQINKKKNGLVFSKYLYGGDVAGGFMRAETGGDYSHPNFNPNARTDDNTHADTQTHAYGLNGKTKIRRHQEIPTDMGIIRFPPRGGFATPFDFLTNDLRDMKGIAVDMFKRPEKLHAACEKVLEWRLARAVPADPKERGRKVGGGANHFQSEEFLSRKQFETFAWPTWKKSLLATIDMGFVPGPFMEGKNDDRIECFLELPKGNAFMWFEKIDIARAKTILGGHLCIVGGVPASLLWGGSPQEVEEHCKNLIKVCGKDGGFILSAAGGGEDDAKPANLKAMVDAVKKYGRY